MTLEIGDRIITTEEVDTGALFGGGVKKGSRGVITGVENGFFAGTTYQVTFENGKKGVCKPKQIARA